MTDDRPTGRDPAPAVTRSIRLLEVLADAGRPLTLTELAGAGPRQVLDREPLPRAGGGAHGRAGAAGLSPGSAHRRARRAFAAQFNQVREFYAVCDASDVLRGELVQVALLDGADALYIAREGGRSLRIGTPLGSRLPAALSATGRAMLSTLDDDAVIALVGAGAEFPALTENSPRTLERCCERLARARERGWALDAEESFPASSGSPFRSRAGRRATRSSPRRRHPRHRGLRRACRGGRRNCRRRASAHESVQRGRPREADRSGPRERRGNSVQDIEQRPVGWYGDLTAPHP
jgi:DNA-binding IclR family transcriptional regulator